MTAHPEDQKDIAITRRLIWLYCFTWLIEGALRKWIFPNYSLQFLLIRDPLVLMIYWWAIRARVFPNNGWMKAFWSISGAIAVQAFFNLFSIGGSVAVIAFGFRTFVLHLPLIWVVAAVFGRKDILALGKWWLYFAPFIAILMVIQFELPGDHWLNAASLKGGSQIGSVGFKIRPPAIFSFITGPIHFFALCAAFTIAGFLKRDYFPRWLVLVGVVSTLVAMSVSGSRALVLGVVVVAAVGAMASLRTGKSAGGAIALAIVVLAVGAFLSRFQVLQEGQAAFEERWSSSEESGDSGGTVIAGRYGRSFTSAFEWAKRVPLFGLGVGISSNLATEHKNFEAPVEQEWERVIYEIGPITGFLYLAFRAALSFKVFSSGYTALRSNNSMCILLGAACALDLLNNNLRQVTTCGYVSICAGLCFAAFKAFSTDSASTNTSEPSHLDPQPAPLEKPRIRGRGPLAVGGKPAAS